MTPLDSSAVNVILPVLQREFALAPEALGQLAWVALAYLLVIGSLILPVGRLGDLWGFRRLFLLGVFGFIVASALCGMAPTLAWLIAARVLQGLAACVMMALSPGMVTAIFPPQERGRAMGVVGMGIALGLVAGPVLGGLLTSALSWRWVFYINLPIGLLGGFWCWRQIPNLPAGDPRPVDWAGAGLATAAIGGILLAITQGPEWGWGSPLVVIALGVGTLALVTFLLVERRIPYPMLDLGLFANRTFAGGNLATMLNFLGQFCAIFLTPLLLQRGLDLSPQRAGMVLAVLPIAVLIVAPVSGALSDRWGTRTLAVLGEVLVAGGLVGMAFALSAGTVPALLPWLALIGVGTGLFQSPNTSAIMGSVPRTHLGIGGGVLATMRNLGMALGTAVSSAVASSGMAHLGQGGAALAHGIRLGYLVGAGFVLLGAVASAWWTEPKGGRLGTRRADSTALSLSDGKTTDR